MDKLLIMIAILAVLVILTNLFSKDEKPAVGSCKNCPEFGYCGGGRPRCPRRGERSK